MTAARPTSVDGACLFCKVAAKQVGAILVAEDEHVVSFLDHRPLFVGHVLVVPRLHHETLADLPPQSLTAVFAWVQRMTRAVEVALHADGTFVAINNRVSQSVPHLHVHVVPRRRKDGLKGFFWPRQKYESETQALAIAESLRAALGEAAPSTTTDTSDASTTTNTSDASTTTNTSDASTTTDALGQTHGDKA